MKHHLTSGWEYLHHSLWSFNGSGYADMTSGEAYLYSYIKYKHWKKQPKGYQLVEQYQKQALVTADKIVATSHGAGRTPSPRSLANFAAYTVTNPVEDNRISLL